MSKEELYLISGGSTLSGTAISALTKIFEVLINSGRYVGSGIRRIIFKSMCPL